MSTAPGYYEQPIGYYATRIGYSSHAALPASSQNQSGKSESVHDYEQPVDSHSTQVGYATQQPPTNQNQPTISERVGAYEQPPGYYSTPIGYSTTHLAQHENNQNQSIGGAPPTATIVRDAQVQPSDYFGFAIFVTICCCLPLGLVALIKSSEVQSRWRSGDHHGAQESSRTAKNLSIAGLVVGIFIWVLTVLYVILYSVVIVISASQNYTS